MKSKCSIQRIFSAGSSKKFKQCQMFNTHEVVTNEQERKKKNY